MNCLNCWSLSVIPGFCWEQWRSDMISVGNGDVQWLGSGSGVIDGQV